MAVKIRLTRMGKKRQPSYRVVVADSRAPRDGRYIEQIGRYDPRQEPSLVEIDTERAGYWLSQGAQPSSQVQKLLEIAGALEARAPKPEKVHVVGAEAQKAAEAEDEAVVAAAAEEPAEEAVEPKVVDESDAEPMAEATAEAEEASTDGEPA